MPFDLNNKGGGSGGGDDPRHDSKKMKQFLKAAYHAFVKAGGASGLCRSCATANFIALLLTEMQLGEDAETKRKLVESIVDTADEWVKLNEEEGTDDILIINV